MFDNTIHAKTLARQFRKSDIGSGPLQVDKDDKDNVISDSIALSRSGFTSLNLRRNTLGGKFVYQHGSLPEAILVRHISENIRRVTGVKQSDRQEIIRCIVSLTREGAPFKVLKLDIRAFYESVNTAAIVEILRRDAAFSRQSVGLLASFFEVLQSRAIPGLPRGIALSATLAEYVMRSFDSAVSGYKGVRFHSRFVDDIIIIVLESVDLNTLQIFCALNLPVGLELSRAKTVPLEFSGYSKANTGIREHGFSFLGYQIDVFQTHKDKSTLSRHVYVDISSKKVSRIKRRLAKSFIRFNDDNKFGDLLNRVKLLTSNYQFEDYSTGQMRFAGLRYNYRLVDPENSQAIQDLDRFLINSLCSKHPNNRIRPNLTNAQRQCLLGLSFRSGFVKNRFFSFSQDEFTRATGCWSHA